LAKLDCRIEELTAALFPAGTTPVEYDVKLLWIADDGTLTDDDGKPYVHKPDAILLSFNA
jgi:hypothetical protein